MLRLHMQVLQLGTGGKVGIKVYVCAVRVTRYIVYEEDRKLALKCRHEI